MTGPLLRTGTFADLHPLGAENAPVHTAAPRLREAIAQHLGPEAANTLAIPRAGEADGTLSWHAPFPGDVTPYGCASAQQRVHAREGLLDVQVRIAELSRLMQADPDPEQQGLGRLLEHVPHFPGEDHIYLVGDRPVVTFWGFRRPDAPSCSGSLLDVGALRAPPAARRGLPGGVWAAVAIAVVIAAFLLLRGCHEEEPTTPAGAEQGLSPWQAPSSPIPGAGTQPPATPPVTRPVTREASPAGGPEGQQGQGSTQASSPAAAPFPNLPGQDLADQDLPPPTLDPESSSLPGPPGGG